MTFGFLSLGRAGAHRRCRPAFFRPPFAGSQTRFCGFVSLDCEESLNFGAGDGNRTRIKSLGSSHSTIELHLRFGCVFIRLRGRLQVFFAGVDKFFLEGGYG